MKKKKKLKSWTRHPHSLNLLLTCSGESPKTFGIQYMHFLWGQWLKRRNYNCNEISLAPGKSMLYITTMSKYNFMDFLGSVLWNMNIFEIYSKQVVIHGLLQYQHEFPPPKWNTILNSPQNVFLFPCAFLQNHYDVWHTGFQLDQDVLVLY